MTFAWPHLLWLTALPVLVLLAELLRRVPGKKSATPAPKIPMAQVSPSSLTIGGSAFQARPRPRVFLALGLALAVAALARPQWGRIEEPVFEQAREIVIAVDLSRSMLAEDVKPSRLGRARLLIESLLERLEGERTGLLVFSGTAFLQSPLSADYEILREFLPLLSPDYLPAGGTDYHALLEAALDSFSDSAADRFLVILSDGESQNEDWRKLTSRLRERGIRILALGIGTPDGAMIPDGSGAFLKDERGAVVLTKLDASILQQLATHTDGIYVNASGWVDLAALIRDTIERGRAGAFVETNRVRHVERFQWALAPALLFLALSVWLEFPVYARPRRLRSAPGSTAALVAAALVSVFSLPSPSAAQAPSGPPAPPPSLPGLVARLAEKPTLSSRDYHDLARTTLNYADALRAQQQPVPSGPVRDALAAGERGRRQAPDATDWESLEKALDQLLAPPPEPPKSEEGDDGRPENQQPSDNPSGQQSPSDSQQGDSSSPSDNPSESGDQSQSSSETPDSDSSESSDSPAQRPDRPAQSAFGEPDSDQEQAEPIAPAESGEDTSEAEPQPPSDADESERSGDTQQVGGTSTLQGLDPSDPATSQLLQRLERIKRQDSPGELFQLMQDPQQSQQQAPSGRNW